MYISRPYEIRSNLPSCTHCLSPLVRKNGNPALAQSAAVLLCEKCLLVYAQSSNADEIDELLLRSRIRG